MIHRIEIAFKVSDTKVDVYTIDKDLNASQLRAIASALSNPVSQIAIVRDCHVPLKAGFAMTKWNWAIEIGYLPGVTDNVGNTAKEIIEDLLKIKFTQDEGCYFSQLMFIGPNISEKEALALANNLVNPIIQRVHLKSFKQFKKDGSMDKVIPKVKLELSWTVDEINLNVSDEELIEIGKKGIKNKDGSRRGPLALSLTYMKTIQSYFKKLGRNPTDIELESITQTWSEHCKHTIFADPIDDLKKGLFKTYIQAATEKILKTKRNFCYSVFTDNSGAIEFNKDYLITDKVETHNSPSALDPFGGAITGIVGVNRDAIGFGLGAKPIVNTYGFCFADPSDNSLLYKGANFTQKMLDPKRIMLGVIEGVNSGGNCSGISTPQGFLVFDKRYKGKPLVFVGTVGFIPKKASVKKARPGDYIVMIGGRVGLDGIHGATFSSEAMDSGSPATAVQIGDPITQKKLSDAVVKEARDLGLYNSITDNGAGGLSCSVAEMAKESGSCRVDLEKVPLKYTGLAPWQIWISESQERMTLAVPKRKWEEFRQLMKKRGVEATVIGEFNKSGSCIVEYRKKRIMEIDMKFLHDGLPVRPMKTTYTPVLCDEPEFKQPADLNRVLSSMLQRLNITSFEFLSSQYDHEVQGGSVLKPLQGKGRVNAETTVTKPILSSKKGVIISQGITPSYGDIDMYHMASCAIDTAIRNAVASGADLNHLALLDNFCWCSPDDPERLGQLKRAVKACYDYAVAYDTPFISGKDSMYNDFKGFDEKGNPVKISIPPTLLISSIGIINDVAQTVSIDIKFPDDLIYVLGETHEEMGGSEYYALHKTIGNIVPKVNAVKNRKLYKAFYHCVEKSLIVSAISVNRGGLAVALAKMSMAGMLGIEISLKDDFASFAEKLCLFSESQGRIAVTVSPVNQREFEKTIKGNSFTLIGKVTNNDDIVIRGKNGRMIIKMKVKEALRAYKSTFKDF